MFKCRRVETQRRSHWAKTTGSRLRPLWGYKGRCSSPPFPAAAGTCVPFCLQSRRHRSRPCLRSVVAFPSSSCSTLDDLHGSNRLIWTARGPSPRVWVSCSAASSLSAPGALPCRGPEHTPNLGTGTWHLRSADLTRSGAGGGGDAGAEGARQDLTALALSVTDFT